QLKEAFHTQCKNCHKKEAKGPQKCDECHPKK
ncbi:MAG: cytochrome C, partial [Deltaproteobacteria bacterium]|nr:cytochrome C [Deltaproteobacteria bacterium]